MTGADRDIVIVGGGPAGSTTALALAHAAPELARRTTILERARYPRDKPCAGALAGRGDALLASVGVRVDVPSVGVDGVSFRGLSAQATARPGRIGRVVRRTDFDHALALAAASRGVDVREGVRVLAVTCDKRGRAHVETTEGRLTANAVLGCDGVGSIVRRALGLGAGGLRAQVVEVDTPPLAGDDDRTLMRFDVSDPRVTGYAWDFPTLVGGRSLVSRGIYRLRLDGMSPASAKPGVTPPGHGQRHVEDDGPDLGALLDQRLRALGIDPAACPRKRYAERGYEPASRLARGPLMLVGEAAGIDPATGEGIAQAIEYGVLAGRFLAARLGARRARHVSLERWTDAVARSRLARDLRIRTCLVRLFFFGPARARLERLLTQSPDMLHVGCQQFAAHPHDWIPIARLALRAAFSW